MTTSPDREQVGPTAPSVNRTGPSKIPGLAKGIGEAKRELDKARKGRRKV